MPSGVFFMDGFESDRDLRQWIRLQGASTGTSYGRGVGAGMQLSHNGPYAAFSTYQNPGGAPSTVIVGMAVNPPVADGSDGQWNQRLLNIEEDGNLHCVIQRNSTTASGTLKVFDATGTLVGETVATVPWGGWTYFEARIVIHNTAGSIEIRLNGTRVFKQDNLDTLHNAAGLQGVAKIISIGDAFIDTSTETVYLDDLYCADGAVSGADFMGDVAIRLLVPKADSSTQWTRSTGAANHETIDETPVSETDYIYTSATGQRDLYAMSAYASEFDDLAIQALKVTLHAGKTDSTTRKVRSVLKDGANEHLGATRYLGSGGGATDSSLFDQRPAGAGEWTHPSVGNLLLGIESVA